MKRLVLVAALAALTAACGQTATDADVPVTDDAAASTTADAAASTTADAASEATEAATTDPALNEDFTLNLEQAAPSQIEGYWWDDGDRYETFRDGRYVAFDKDGLRLITNARYVIVNSCEDRTPNPAGAGILIHVDVRESCWETTSVVNNQFSANVDGGHYIERLVVGDQVQTLNDAYTAVPAP